MGTHVGLTVDGEGKCDSVGETRRQLCEGHVLAPWGEQGYVKPSRGGDRLFGEAETPKYLSDGMISVQSRCKRIWSVKFIVGTSRRNKGVNCLNSLLANLYRENEVLGLLL
ncbi:hypothetical protein J6590_001683 [Homalodisca vitripennis]|nr:hypothetical protein J6590_001683 [Homalodisca vitripennis]